MKSRESVLQPRVIDRLHTLPDPIVTRYSQSLSRDKMVASDRVEVVWVLYPGGAGGALAFEYARRLGRSAVLSGDNSVRNTIITGLEVVSNNGRRNPFESLAAVFSAIATIHSVSLISDEPLTHLVRANKGSRGFFDRFVAEGFYDYSDFDCGIRDESKILSSDYLLYTTTYPNYQLASGLGKFAIGEAVGLLVQIRSEL